MALSQSSAKNLKSKLKHSFETSNADDLSIVDSPESGIKGGYIQKDAVDSDDEPWSLVDYLWKHRDD